MKIEMVKCGICGNNHSTMHCTTIAIKMHIVDKPVIPKARLTLPDELEIQQLSDSSFTVFTRSFIEKGTQFGPFQAKKLFSLLPLISFPLKIFLESEDELSEYYLDTTDEYECSWMMFVEPADSIEEQNLICYQDGDDLFYAAIKDIKTGDKLKVWYSSYYASKMKKEVLSKPIENEEIRNSPSVDDLIEQKNQFVSRKTWSCKICGKVENKVTQFADHLMGHYNAKLKKICEICKEKFLHLKDLEKHKKIIHGTNLILEGEKQDISQRRSNPSLQCLNKQDGKGKDSNVGGPMLLQDSLDNCSLLLQHTDLSQFDLNSIDNHSFENENLGLNVDSIFNENVKELDHFNFDLNDAENDQLVCDICLKSFQKLKYLVLHMAQHTGKYTCFECKRVFARKENLSFHSCKSYYKLKCPSCDKLFFQMKALNQHIKYAHKKAFACEKCKKNCQTQKQLDQHNCSSENSQKNFTCKVCSKQFTTKGNLLSHMKLHENTDHYTCPICNKTLNSRSTYRKHEIIHYGAALTCEECNRIFTRHDTLKRHKETVHNKQSVTCEVCKKSLSTKHLLKKHMAIHLSDKQFSCTICSKPFRAKHNLQRHIKKIHNSKKYSDNTGDKYSCPRCHAVVKYKQSFVRHVQKHHPGHDYLLRTVNSKNMKPFKNVPETVLKEDDLVLDLKQTIENMNFNTDEISNCNETDINFEIDKLLNNATNIDSLLSESNDRLVESLIDIAMNETHGACVPISFPPKEGYLSMPDLGSST